MVDVQGLLRLDADLIASVEDVFASLRRKGWQERSHCYLTGLLLDGRRKSVEPMAPGWTSGMISRSSISWRTRRGIRSRCGRDRPGGCTR